MLRKGPGTRANVEFGHKQAGFFKKQQNQCIMAMRTWLESGRLLCRCDVQKRTHNHTNDDRPMTPVSSQTSSWSTTLRTTGALPCLLCPVLSCPEVHSIVS